MCRRAGDAAGMRWITMGSLLVLAGCGGHAAPGPGGARDATPSATATGGAPRQASPPGGATPTPTATPSFTASAAGPWTARPARRRSPLRCPASSSRAGWPSRVLALGDGSYAKLWGRRPRYASVDWRGHLYDQIELGARRASDERAFACWRQGRTGAAWTEYRGHSTYALRVALRPDGAKTADVVQALYDGDGISDVAVAFSPGGTLLVVYAVDHEVRAVTMTADSELSEPVELGPAFEVTDVQAEISRGGRAVVAWTTIDAGEERNERRRVYAVTGRVDQFGEPQLVDRARHVNIAACDPRAGPARGRAPRPRGAAVGHRPPRRGRRLLDGDLLRPHGRGRNARALRATTPAVLRRRARRRRDPRRRPRVRGLDDGRRPARRRRPRPGAPRRRQDARPARLVPRRKAARGMARRRRHAKIEGTVPSGFDDQGEQGRRDRGREVQRGHARAHRQREAEVGAGEQVVREAVALGAERQERARSGRAPRRRVSPSGSSAISGRSPVRIMRERATGSAKCRPAEPRSASACHGSCSAGGDHARRARGRGHAHAGAEVAEVARLLEQRSPAPGRPARRSRPGRAAAGAARRATTCARGTTAASSLQRRRRSAPARRRARAAPTAPPARPRRRSRRRAAPPRSAPRA